MHWLYWEKKDKCTGYVFTKEAKLTGYTGTESTNGPIIEG